jgi:hypothetical protein
MPSDNHRQHLQPHQHRSQHPLSHLHPQPNNLRQSPLYSNKSDFLKDSLIVFRDEQDQTSESTALSQQELLQKKRREQTTQQRKDKNKSSNKKNQLVNLPASLLNHSSRQPQQQAQPQQQKSPLPPKPKPQLRGVVRSRPRVDKTIERRRVYLAAMRNTNQLPPKQIKNNN